MLLSLTRREKIACNSGNLARQDWSGLQGGGIGAHCEQCTWMVVSFLA